MAESRVANGFSREKLGVLLVFFYWRKTSSGMVTASLLMFLVVTSLPYLLLMYKYLLVCLGWIMKATCCLLRYDPKLMFEVVNLNMPCFYYEIFHNHANSCICCVYSHLIGGLTGGS